MKVPLQWVWENDPKGLPDDDHARCIAAPGERFLACGAQLFALTTRPCTYLSASDGGRSAVSFSTLQMEYLGLDWARGLAQEPWGVSDPTAGRLAAKPSRRPASPCLRLWQVGYWRARRFAPGLRRSSVTARGSPCDHPGGLLPDTLHARAAPGCYPSQSVAVAISADVRFGAA